MSWRLMIAAPSVAVVLLGNVAAGDSPRSGERERSPFTFRATVDGPVLGGALALWLAPSLFEKDLPGPPCDPCDASQLNALDRPVVHFNSRVADQASDALVVVVPVLAVGGTLLDYRRWGWRGVGEDVLLIAETMAVTGMVQRVVSYAVRRPRPFMYRAEPAAEARQVVNANLSFFSGHTAAAFSAATSFATIYSIRRPRSPLRPLVWIVALGAASTVPVLRVGSGEHFWTDVIAGALVGSAFGVLIPMLHRSRPAGHRRPLLPSWVTLVPGPGAGLGLSAWY